MKHNRNSQIPFKFNFFFYVFILFCSAILLASLYLSACMGTPTILEDFSNSFGVACQVVTTIVCCIASITGISFSLQDSYFFGIETKDFRSLRVENHFSFSLIIVLSVVLVSLNLAAFLINWPIASLGISFVAIVFCIYVICSEVPLMVKDERVGIKIMKHRLMSNVSASAVLSRKFDDALKYIILEKNLKTAYKLFSLSGKNAEKTNRKILLKLLDLQTDIAFHLENIENKSALELTIECLSGNITDILKADLDIEAICEDNLENYTHYITRVLHKMSQIDDGKASAAALFKYMLTAADYSPAYESKKTQRDFIVSIVLIMVSSSTNSGNYFFLDTLMQYYSTSYYRLNEKCSSSLIFALVSMYLYNLCVAEPSVPKQIKNDVTALLGKSGQIKNCYYKPWNELFHRFARTFSVDYSEFLQSFVKHERTLEYIPFDGEAHFVSFDLQFAISWYLTNLFNSVSVAQFDYLSLEPKELIDNIYHKSDYRYYIEKFAEKCFAENGIFSPSQDMCKILDFYGFNDKSFSLFKCIESNATDTHSFLHFVNHIRKEHINQSANEADDIDNTELAQKYKQGFEDAIKNEWGYNNELEILTDPKFFRVLIEKSKEIINIDEVIIDGIITSFCNELRNNIEIKTFKIDSDFSGSIIPYTKNKVRYISPGTKESCKLFIPPEMQDTVLAWISDATVFDSKVLYPDILIINSDFSFNYIIDDFSINDLTQTQLSDKLESYKRSDGQYIYEGAFMNREELEGIVDKKYKVLSIQLKYQLKYANDSIIQLDLFSSP